MERQEFEGSLKEAFDQAEVSPSEQVWTNIELGLERAEGDKIKRRLVFYKMLAAASVFIGMCFGAAGIYFFNESQSAKNAMANLGGQLQTEVDKALNVPGASNVPSENVPETSEVTEDVESVAFGAKRQLSTIVEEKRSIPFYKDTNASSGENSYSGTIHTGNLNNGMAATENKNETILTDETGSGVIPRNREGVFRDRPLPVIATVGNADPDVIRTTEKEESEVLPEYELLARLDLDEPAEEEKKKSSERFWSSIGVAAGPFNSINSSVGAGGTAANQNRFMQSSSPVNNTLNNETKASGIAYSVGFQLGGKVSERWVVQGGVNYLTQHSEYMSTVVVESATGTFVAGNSQEFARQADTKVYTTASHEVNNEMQFVSVPVQAGFLIVNKAVGVQVNGGVSTDIFLQNTITSPGGSLETVKEESGSDSPYRPVNFSGLFSTEFSYRFAHRYRIAVSPGIRYPLNSIYKSELGLQSIPLSFDVGLRFRYIFN